MASRTETLGMGRSFRPLAAAVTVALVALSLSVLPTRASASSGPPTPVASASTIASIVRATMSQYQLRAVIVRVTQGNRVLATQAFGTSMDGVPATTSMHFRNGAVAFEYISTLLLEYVDEHKVTLNETIDHWLPDLPESHQVTLKMLANQTSGYPDFETDPTFIAQFNSNPFQIFSYQERLKDAFNRPVQFAPGTNWSYSHTNFMILGRILSMIGRAPLAVLLQRKVLAPMGLTQTTANRTSGIPSPVLHSFSSERRTALGVPDSSPFYEESTFWNAQWGTPDGASETTDIYDMVKTADAVGTGKLLTRSSYHAMTDPNLLGFGEKQPNCVPSCFKQIPAYNYGLGVVRSGSWLLQNPLLGGYSASEAYLPSKKVAVAVVTTFEPGAFDCQGNYDNASDVLWRKIAATVAPADAPTPSPAEPPTGCS